MQPVTPSSTFEFKGLTLKPGDHVAFQAKKIPLPHIEGAFTHVDEQGRMVVFSTLLVPFAHIKDNGSFAADEIGQIEVVRSGAEAVPLEARNAALRHGQRVKSTIQGGRTFIGILLAAFDGIVTMWPEQQVGNKKFVADGLVTGGSSHFAPA